MLLVAFVAMTACSGSDDSAQPDSSDVADTAADSTALGATAEADPQPMCDDRAQPAWLAAAAAKGHEGDGVADPAGRIFFGQFLYEDEIVAQVVQPLFAIDPDGSDAALVLDCQIARPRVSPDGERLAFSIMMDNRRWQVATSAVDGSDLRIITSDVGLSETPEWSPDGESLIYSYLPCPSEDWEFCVGPETDGWALWRMDKDGETKEILTEQGVIAWEPRLSPDGGSAVFSRWDQAAEADAKMWIVVRDLTTGEERSVEHPVLNLEHPVWSPDGRWITYNTTSIEPCIDCERVERVRADDLQAEPEVLYPAPPGGMKPAYSPDGSQIVFGCGIEVCVMGANGEDPIVLMGIEGELVNHFAWGSSG